MKFAFAVATLTTYFGFPTSVVADPPPDPQPESCRVFCFRFTDIKYIEPGKFDFEFEVLNWSDAFAGTYRQKQHRDPNY